MLVFCCYFCFFLTSTISRKNGVPPKAPPVSADSVPTSIFLPLSTGNYLATILVRFAINFYQPVIKVTAKAVYAP